MPARRAGLAGLCLAAAVLACGAPGALAAQLAGSEWRPVELEGRGIPGDSGQFVRFGGEGKLEGHGGCNRFFGSYVLDGAAIAIGPLGATRMACPEPAMDREMRLFTVLERAATIRRNGTELLLYAADGRPLARLVQTDWD